MALGNLGVTFKTDTFEDGPFELDNFTSSSVWSPEFELDEELEIPISLPKLPKGSPHPDYPLICWCDVQKMYETVADFKQHQKSHRIPLECQTCARIFKCPSELLQHYRSHQGVKPFHCSDCDKKYTKHSGLVYHRLTHTNVRPHKCTKCPAAFTYSGGLIYHARTHTGAKPYKCEVCNKNFSYSFNLVEHMRTHTGEKPFACDKCGEKFAGSSSCNRHKKTCRGTKTCSKCGKEFADTGNFSNHEKTCTGSTICKSCGKDWEKASKLKTHEPACTGGVYICSKCGFDFKDYSPNIFTTHQNSCKGKTKHQCPVCKMYLSRGDTLTKHMKRQHTPDDAPEESGSSKKRNM